MFDHCVSSQEFIKINFLLYDLLYSSDLWRCQCLLMNTLLFSLKKPNSCARLSNYSSARNCLAYSRERHSFSSEFWRRELHGSCPDFSVLTSKRQQDDLQKLNLQYPWGKTRSSRNALFDQGCVQR